MKNLTYNMRTATYEDTELNQSFELFLPDGNIAVAVSGGLDSTALIFLICKYITDLKLESKISVKPIHSVCKEQSNSLSITQDIIEDLYKTYPNIDIADLEVFGYSLKDYKDKREAHDEFHTKLHAEDPELKLIVAALTSLPSRDIINKWNLSSVDEKRILSKRSVNQIRDNGILNYKPMINVDKKIVASLHIFLKLNKNYVKTTWTCTRYAEHTKAFTKPCGYCYHCKEKEWAFGHF